MTIEPEEISGAKRILRNMMKQQGLSLADAEKKAIEVYGNDITFNQAKLAILQEEAEQEPPKSA